MVWWQCNLVCCQFDPEPVDFDMERLRRLHEDVA